MFISSCAMLEWAAHITTTVITTMLLSSSIHPSTQPCSQQHLSAAGATGASSLSERDTSWKHPVHKQIDGTWWTGRSKHVLRALHLSYPGQIRAATPHHSVHDYSGSAGGCWHDIIISTQQPFSSQNKSTDMWLSCYFGGRTECSPPRTRGVSAAS